MDRFPCPHTNDVCQRGDCPSTACVLDLDPRRPVVYVAGPYTSPDPISTTRRAIAVGAAMLDAGLFWPLVPHQSMIFDLLCPRPIAEWYALDLALLERCDALYRLSGQSRGADREVLHARSLGLPVFIEQDPDELPPVLTEWAEEFCAGAEVTQ